MLNIFEQITDNPRNVIVFDDADEFICLFEGMFKESKARIIVILKSAAYAVREDYTSIGRIFNTTEKIEYKEGIYDSDI